MPMSHADPAMAEQAFGAPMAFARQPASAHANVSANDVQLTIHNDLAAAEADWRALENPAGCTVFQTYEWLSAWQRHVGSSHGATPCIVIGRDAADKVLFILPLAIRATGFVRELTWLGSDLCDYNMPLLATENSDRLDSTKFTAVWARVIKRLQANALTRHDMIRLEKMPATIAGRPNPMLALPTGLNPSGSYATPLSDSWDAFYGAKRSSSTRRRDRSKRKNLAEAGEVKLVTAVTPTDALGTLTVLVEQKTVTFARHGLRNLFALPGYLDFFRDIASNPHTRDLVHISRLQAGEQTVAANLGLVFGDRYYHVLASYTDGDLSRWGPGAAHLNDLLRYAIERGLKVFDFTIGDERYKRDWCDGVQPLHDHVSAASWRGAVMTGPAITLQKLKRTIKQTPMLWAAVVKARAIAASLRARAKAADPVPEAESDPK
jgi:CelD/BcsL family acetyltransferase involved in cellulose biosynthesis